MVRWAGYGTRHSRRRILVVGGAVAGALMAGMKTSLREDASMEGLRGGDEDLCDGKSLGGRSSSWQ